MTERRFPIQGGPSILWSVVAPYEAQAMRNHGQTLERLAERHGLSPYELCCLLDNKRLSPLPDTSAKDWEEPYRLRLVALVEAENALESRLAAAEAKLVDVMRYHGCDCDSSVGHDDYCINTMFDRAEAALSEALDSALHDVLEKAPMHPYLQEATGREIKLTVLARFAAALSRPATETEG